MERSVPPITVLMSVYNEEITYLKTAIQSILCQSFKSFEFIIIDDGSTDGACKACLKDFAVHDNRIRLVINDKNLGLTASLNRGLKLASGKYIARIDSDDIAYPERLEKQHSFLEEHPSYVLCGSWSYLINEDDEIIGQKRFHTTYREIRKNILSFNFFTHSSLFFRTETVRKHGGYTPKMERAQDYDLVLKLVPKHPIANIPEFLCFYRISKKSISEAQYKSQEGYAVLARLRALTRYGLPLFTVIKTLPALFSFLFIPSKIKKYIIFLVT